MEPLQINFKVSSTSDPTVLRRLIFKNSDLTYSSLYAKVLILHINIFFLISKVEKLDSYLE
jgi:hypothetical protein